MRKGGKGNNIRKILSYYSVNFNVCPPYQILCDGPTIFWALKNDFYLKQSLPKLLGTTAYPVVTDCIVRELRSLGEEHSNAALFAKRATRIPCAHDGPATAHDCVVSRITTPHETKLFLATSDADILKHMSKVPGIPLICVENRTRLSLRSPSQCTLGYVRQLESSRAKTLSEQDQSLLNRIRAEEEAEKPEPGPTRKRKRAKGPNPLSMKKPKRVGNTSVSSARPRLSGDSDSFEDKKIRKRLEEQSRNRELKNCSAEGNALKEEGDGVGNTEKSKRKRKRRKRADSKNMSTDLAFGHRTGDSYLDRNGTPRLGDETNLGTTEKDKESVENRARGHSCDGAALTSLRKDKRVTRDEVTASDPAATLGRKLHTRHKSQEFVETQTKSRPHADNETSVNNIVEEHSQRVSLQNETRADLDYSLTSAAKPPARHQDNRRHETQKEILPKNTENQTVTKFPTGCEQIDVMGSSLAKDDAVKAIGAVRKKKQRKNRRRRAKKEEKTSQDIDTETDVARNVKAESAKGTG